MIGFLLNALAAVASVMAAVDQAFEHNKWGCIVYAGAATYWILNAIYRAIEETR